MEWRRKYKRLASFTWSDHFVGSVDEAIGFYFKCELETVWGISLEKTRSRIRKKCEPSYPLFIRVFEYCYTWSVYKSATLTKRSNKSRDHLLEEHGSHLRKTKISLGGFRMLHASYSRPFRGVKFHKVDEYWYTNLYTSEIFTIKIGIWA